MNNYNIEPEKLIAMQKERNANLTLENDMLRAVIIELEEKLAAAQPPLGLHMEAEPETVEEQANA